MGIETIIGVVGLGISAAGTVAGVVGQQQQAAASKRAEELRQRQMNLDAQRQKRDLIRRAAVAQATATAAAEAQGASGGSALQGALGEIGGSTGRAVTAVNQNQEIGNGIFDANKKYAEGGSLASLGSGISSLGGALVSNAGVFGKIFAPNPAAPADDPNLRRQRVFGFPNGVGSY